MNFSPVHHNHDVSGDLPDVCQNTRQKVAELDDGDSCEAGGRCI